MSEDTTTTKIKFQVTIETKTIPPIFTFYNEQHQATNGNATTYCGEETYINYTLSTPDFFFVAPFITNNVNGDFHYGISEQGQKLIIVDNGQYTDAIGLQLIVEQQSTGQRYASPDPKIANRPR